MVIRGMREVRTARELTMNSLRVSQAQLVAELAHAEHEKARLERELTMWVANQRKAERQLQRVMERIGLLWNSLDKRSPRRKRKPASRRLSRPVRPRELPLAY